VSSEDSKREIKTETESSFAFWVAATGYNLIVIRAVSICLIFAFRSISSFDGAEGVLTVIEEGAEIAGLIELDTSAEGIADSTTEVASGVLEDFCFWAF
jgi:hypothetical protein